MYCPQVARFGDRKSSDFATLSRAVWGVQVEHVAYARLLSLALKKFYTYQLWILPQSNDFPYKKTMLDIFVSCNKTMFFIILTLG